jgi:hypothetical protein
MGMMNKFLGFTIVTFCFVVGFGFGLVQACAVFARRDPGLNFGFVTGSHRLRPALAFAMGCNPTGNLEADRRRLIRSN